MASAPLNTDTSTQASSTADGLDTTSSDASSSHAPQRPCPQDPILAKLERMSDAGSGGDDPSEGKTFAIRHKATGGIITLTGGKLLLTNPGACNASGAFLWECENHNGWLRFKSSVSGTYMGVPPTPGGGSPLFDFTVDKAGYGDEFHVDFCPMYGREGGYVLGLVKSVLVEAFHNFASSTLVYMNVEEQRGTLVQTTKRGTVALWEFVEV